MSLSSHVACCPICGGRVRAYIQTSIVQNDDGDWELEFEPTAEDLNLAVSNLNQEVECTNHHCGPARDCYGNRIPEEALADPFEYWKDFIIGNEDIVPSDAKESDLNEINPNLVFQYQQWKDSIMYEPWTGVLAECIDLQGRTFESIADSERVGK